MRFLKRAAWILGFFTILVAYTNCSGADFYENTSTTDTTTSTSTLYFTYSPSPVYVGNTTTLIASGGTAPYTYTLYSGSGVVSSSTFYATAEGTMTILVTDSAGLSQYFTIVVYSTSTSSTSTSSFQAVYRFRSILNRHFFSLSSTEGTSAGLYYEGVGFFVLTTALSGTLPLYRCFITNVAHFVSTSSYCGGYTNEGLYGYGYSYAATGSTPLYSFYNSNYDYLVTTNYGEGINAGLVYSGIIAYVPAN